MDNTIKIMLSIVRDSLKCWSPCVPCLSPGLLISRAQMLMFPLRKTWTRNWMKLVCLKAEVAKPRDIQLCPRCLCAEEHCVPQIWGVWGWRKDVVPGSLGLLDPSGGSWALCSWVVCWLGLLGSAGVVWQSCALASSCSSGNGLALYSCNIRDNPKPCLLYVCVVFSLVRRVIWWACQLSHLQKFTVLTSSTRCCLASLLESLCYCICK